MSVAEIVYKKLSGVRETNTITLSLTSEISSRICLCLKKLRTDGTSPTAPQLLTEDKHETEVEIEFTIPI